MKINFYHVLVLGLFIFASHLKNYGQTNVDIGTPASSPFQLGSDISGSAQNSINEVTGKVAFSVPLSSIASGPVSYDLSLGYNGQSAFKTGSELNKYSPTSIIGVGWSLSVPKIVVDNKQTTTREDDVFYIIDGATNTKLICINKTSTYWEFKTEKFSNWIIKYHHTISIFEQDHVTGQFEVVSKSTDYWSITKEDGFIYYFGYSSYPYYTLPTISSLNKSKEFISTWGNWIGDSNKNPTGVSTVVWNISRIEDQWNNQINFKYDLVEGQQNMSQSFAKHTEASYLTEVISSKGSKIKLNYENKNPLGTFISEYYEPHKEKQEPDAYQERYEKKFLSQIEVFNTKNQLVLSYDFAHDIESLTNSDDKRYLTNITQTTHNQGQSNALPPQIFEYHYTGTFKGGLKKMTYPSGASVTYNYQNKLLFSNGVNRFVTAQNLPSGYVDFGVHVSDNYNLLVRKKTIPISTDKYQFDFYRYLWNGKEWEESNRFQFPNGIIDNYNNGQGDFLKDFYAVYQENFYAFLYDKGTTADIHMFHKEKNGNSWHYQKRTVSIGNDEPSLLSGKDFIAVGTKRTGDLFTYTWNGAYWLNNPTISQGSGEYYYAATNNFVLSLNENGGNDMITGTWHHDNYYIHYLDAEKNWQTKSWSAYADPFINDIWINDNNPGNVSIFPSNGIAGYVLKDNNELFLRWDENYNLIAVDDEIGAYDDTRIFQPVNNSMFTLIFNGTNNGKISARFNGVDWSTTNFSNISRYTNFDIDFALFEGTSTMMKYKEYSPNTDSWVEENLNSYATFGNFYWNRNSINREFFIAGKSIYKRTNLGVPSFPIQNIGTLPYYNYFSYSDGLSHTYVNQYLNNNTFVKGSYFYVDKKTGLVLEVDLGSKYHIISGGNGKLGGYTPFMSPRAIWLTNPTSIETKYLYRIIDDKFDQSIYDIVVGNIELDDKNSNNRIINYTYNDPNPSANNDVTYYGEVITEHKGFGSSSNGKIKKLFDDGSEDIRRVGLLLEEQVLDINNNVERKTINQWQNISSNILNNNNQNIEEIQHTRLLYKTLYEFGNSSIWNRTTYSYNGKSQISQISNQNSKGQQEKQVFRYAHEQYSFAQDKNMLTGLYQTKTSNNDKVVDVKQNIWSNISNKLYITQKKSGSNLSNLRVDSNITYVDPNGNLLEGNNGNGSYNTILLGYSNLYEVATFVNARYQDIVNELDVSYTQLQNLNTENLKIELMKLYERLPDVMMSLTFYDDNGRVTNTVNERKEESYLYYDVYGRVDYVTDGYGNILKKEEYNFGN